MRKVIVYTRHDGGVDVCTPSANCIRFMTNGGRWGDRPRGYLATQIERLIADGIAADHARRFVNAMQFGGLTTAEAWGAIRDRDCARRGTMHELQDANDFPDKWFRNAWKRSANGGPVVVSLAKARPLQLEHIKSAVERFNSTKTRVTLQGIRAPVRVDWGRVIGSINHARDVEELARIWPEAIPHPQRIAA